MTQVASRPDDRVETSEAICPTIWGLSARDIHDAFWRARGVQCVRRGEKAPLSKAADLFLLIEPRQLMLFDLAKLADRLIWRRATVTRLRILDQEAEPYTEQVVADTDGWVERIERRYVPRTRAAYRVFITSNRVIASRWAVAADRRETWKGIRRSVGRSRLDYCRYPGGCFLEGDHGQERDLIDRLVALWSDPGQAIEGIEQVGRGIWAAAGAAVEHLSEDVILVRPIWFGYGRAPGPETCLVGPAWLPDRNGGPAAGRPTGAVRDISDIPLAEHTGTAASRRTGSTYATAKRGFDIIASAVILALLLPLFGVVALTILIEGGRPIFYGHRRQSRGGTPFLCWKFRTMKPGSEQLVEELSERNICDGPQVLIKNDPRVTRIGGLLRVLHVDELPQFWNVLRGEMSIVGPRPSPDDENQYCPAWRELRLSVRPGVTGLWQLRRTRAPGEDFQEWIRYDMEYVRRANFWLDLSILAQTAWIVLIGRATR
jgi:lipopolysaccharide/colanic/teichoic acid biosynthesis glycosyltransferase